MTPSLVIVGAPNFFSITTLRPFGPSVTLTVSASLLTPASSPRRAASSNLRALACVLHVIGGAAVAAPPCDLWCYFLVTVASTSRPVRIKRSSPSTVISVPPYFE